MTGPQPEMDGDHVTDQPTPVDEYVPPHRTRIDVAVALARVEAKLDVAIAQDRARLDEHARGIAENKAAIERVEGRVGVVEQKQAGIDAVNGAKPAPVGLATYVPIGISLILLVLYLIEKYQG